MPFTAIASPISSSSRVGLVGILLRRAPATLLPVDCTGIRRGWSYAKTPPAIASSRHSWGVAASKIRPGPLAEQCGYFGAGQSSSFGKTNGMTSSGLPIGLASGSPPGGREAAM
jgi:hypothetical protein